MFLHADDGCPGRSEAHSDGPLGARVGFTNFHMQRFGITQKRMRARRVIVGELYNACFFTNQVFVLVVRGVGSHLFRVLLCFNAASVIGLIGG